MRLVRPAVGRAACIALVAVVAVAGALPASAASGGPSTGASAARTGGPSWSPPPAGAARTAAAKLRAASHGTARSSRSYESATPPSPCYYSIWQEDSSASRDANQIDGSVYAAMYDCPSATWSFPLQTYDSWPSSELSFYTIPIDTDFNPSTGCGGFEWLLLGTYDSGSGSLLAGLFSTPDCNTANQVANAGVSRANGQQVTLTLPNSALGNPTNIRWVARTQGTGNTNAVDTMPDTSAVPNYHQEDGYTHTGCTVNTLGAGPSSANSYAAVDDPPAAAAALEADGRPGVRAHGAHAGVVHYTGDPFAGAVALARHGIRATVSPDHVRRYTATPNDPQFGQQWGLQAVGASAAWDVTQGSSLVIVGDLDSGVDATHPDLAGKLVPGEDETTNPPQPLSMTTNTDDANHGTATAGVIGAATNNGTDVASLGWNTAVMPIKVGTAAGVTTSDEVAGLQYAVQHGVKIANLSLGSECYDATEANEVASAQASGLLIVAAAGNGAGSGDRVSYPAALPGVLSVGATGRDGNVASYSNFGAYVDMVAPGGSADGNAADDLLLLSNNGGVMTAAGTSFSAPLASAAAALLLAVNPAYTPDNLRSLLMDTATPLYGGRNPWTGVGMLNAARALQIATLRSSFNPLTPARILDTRDGTGDAAGPLNGGETRAETIDGLGGVPPTGVSAVAMNVTVTQPSANGFVTIYPDGGSRPNASNLNFTAGETIPNLVVVPVGPDGKVDLYNLVGSTHVIFDVVGWYGSTGDSFNPLTPARILDTRNGTGDSGGPFGTGETRAETIDGRGGVPASGVAAVVMNVTVTQPTVNGFLTLYPTGAARPNASNLNFTAGETIPNLVVVPVGPDGKVNVYNLVGSTHVIFDVVGWYGSTGAPFSPLPPHRILDTRDGTGDAAGAFNTGETRAETIDGRGGVPASGVAAVVMNVTVTQPTVNGFLTLYPTGAGRPNASNLNFTAGETIPNLVVVPVGPDGKVDVYNLVGSTHVIFDVVGWYPSGS